jgi:hypothetical protein
MPGKSAGKSGMSMLAGSALLAALAGAVCALAQATPEPYLGVP